MEWLKAENIYKSFGETEVLHGVSFAARKGEIIALLGRSGSGKTTLLRILAGLETADEGSFSLKGEHLSSSPEKRPIGMVFQEYALFPHLTVAKNIAFGLDRGTDKETRVSKMLQLVDLEGYGSRYPHELSGGQQQRVAIARALAPAPALLLLDEPFSNLDASLKHQVRSDIASILHTTDTTGVFVTHDISDALAIADRIVVLADGVNVREGTPEELYNQPGHYEVTSLFGDWNVLAVDALENSSDPLAVKTLHSRQGTDEYIAVPYQAIKVTERESSMSGIVETSQYAGSHYQVTLECGNLLVVAVADKGLEPGAEVFLEMDPSLFQTF